MIKAEGLAYFVSNRRLGHHYSLWAWNNIEYSGITQTKLLTPFEIHIMTYLYLY